MLDNRLVARRVVLAVGLTGGHIYPAKALAQQLVKEQFQFLFVAGKNSSLAKTILEEEGYPLLPVEVCGMPRGPKEVFIRGFAFLWSQLKACALLWRAFRDWKPALVVGFGSYVTPPAIIAAKILGIPTVIFEPNAKLGIANGSLAWLCDKVVCAFDLPLGKAVLIEPPLRKSVLESAKLSKEACRESFGLSKDVPCVLIFGGSQGARAINNAFGDALEHLRKENISFSFVHVTGAGDFEETKSFYEAKRFLGGSGVVLSYLEDIAKAYQAADLVVSRSGAMTCLELIHFKLPCVLIPLPHSTESHQFANAKRLEDLGLARVLQERDALSQSLYQALKEILSGGKQNLERQVKLNTVTGKTFKQVVEELIGSDVR